MTIYNSILAIVKGGRLAELHGNAVKVLLCYVAHSDSQGCAHPSVATICRLTGIGCSGNMWRARTELINRGLLKLVRRTKLSTVYQVTIPDTVKNTVCEIDSVAPDTVVSTGATLSKSQLQHCKNHSQKQAIEASHRSKKKGAAAPLPEIPNELDTPEFREAWAMWLEHRKELNRKKPVTPTAAKCALVKLQQMGAERAVAAIEHSTAQGWVGIFEDRKAGQSYAKKNKRLIQLRLPEANPHPQRRDVRAGREHG